MTNFYQKSAVIEELTGLIERITFHNQDTGFFVIKTNVRGHRDLVTVVGSSQTISVGEHFKAEGSWVQDKAYGPQFRSQRIISHPPTTVEGIIKYLSSGLIKGIGPAYGKRLVNAFGQEVFDVIESSPEKLQEVEGIGKKRGKIIADGWAEQKQIREIMVFLHAHGISTARAVRIYKTYGDQSIHVLKTNPYKLAQDIKGIGFLSADKIAESLGIEKESPERIKAGLSHILLTGFDNGLCGLPKEALAHETTKLLEINPEPVSQVLDQEILTSDLIEFEDSNTNKSICYMPVVYHTEKAISTKLKRIQGTRDSITINVDKAVEWVQTQISFSLSASQLSALQTAIESKLCIITGGPGVGKTTLVKCLLKILSIKASRIHLVAPTGRAAKRLSESTGKEASTLHKLLSFSPKVGGFKYNENNKLKGDVFIVDESSMIDIFLLHSFLKAMPDEARICFIGDIDQLPSVGPGQVLKDMIMSQTLPVVRLTEIFRQGKESHIILNAHRINHGKMPINEEGKLSDFHFIAAETPEEGLELVLKYMVAQSKGGANTPKVQILTPMKSGILGTRTLNASLQQKLNPNKSPSVIIFGQTYLVGDPVIQMSNNYDKDVYNGDIGKIIHIDAHAKQVIITYEQREVSYDFGEMDQVDLSYAMTIHKSQGSEFPVVILPIFMSHYKLLMRNLIYTGITRGKHKVIVIGQKKALYLGIQNNSHLERNSLLKHWLYDQYS
ncbi:MAG: ATP-dependent RecD-like DNA helicase [Rickettsiales bacterium]|nr:ATP-dependent RecD-like DNA helicase [Rickettsiales bacterium]|tara:strand:+ start:25146 stop:27326 length:2181 start_codon:yes stop_codon:yes gene_type:complete